MQRKELERADFKLALDMLNNEEISDETFFHISDLFEAIGWQIDNLKEALRTKDEYYKQVFEDGALQIRKYRDDSNRLDWLLNHTDATVCNEGNYGPYHVLFRYSGRAAESAPTKREAIDKAMKGEKNCTE